jgi:hypothetical protein
LPAHDDTDGLLQGGLIDLAIDRKNPGTMCRGFSFWSKRYTPMEPLTKLPIAVVAAALCRRASLTGERFRPTPTERRGYNNGFR